MIIVWGSAKQKYLKPANKCLKTAGRFILGKKKRDSVTNDITESLQWLLPKKLYEFKVMYFIKQFLIALAPYFFYTVVELEQADSRSGMMSRTHLHFKNSYSDRLLESVAVKLYKNLPEALRNEDILACFKNNLLKHVLAAQHK